MNFHMFILINHYEHKNSLLGFKIKPQKTTI